MEEQTTHHDLVTSLPKRHVTSLDEELVLQTHNLSDNKDDHDNIDSDELEDGDLASDVDGDADSMVGVSMSRLQNDMKSPTTPAASKAQALDVSRSYFDVDDALQSTLTSEPIEQPLSDKAQNTAQSSSKASSEPAPKAVVQATSPSHITIKNEQEQQQKAEKRSSFVTAILGSATSSSRQRSSSGSSVMDSLRQKVPSFPNFNFVKLYSQYSSGLGNASDNRTSSNAQVDPRQQIARSAIYDRRHEASHAPPNLQTISVVQNDNPTIQTNTSKLASKGLLRRTTSDQSLYLRKTATGASDFDDYTAFANQSEMVNSRFKAITDSFQDSSIRRPRILSLSRDNERATSDIRATNHIRTKDEPEKLGGPRTSRMQAAAVTNDVNPTSKHPVLKGVLSQLSGDLVIMGGYRGSILREAQPPNRQLWVPIKVGMNLRKADLEVGLSREDELRMEETIIPDGALSHIGPVDICRRLLKKCKKCPNIQTGKLRLHNYGYDWRLSPDLLSQKLTRYLESLPCNQSSTPAADRGAWVVAHSLGGLITRHVINSRPELVAGVVYAGTPQNCVNILGPLRNGDDVLFSSRVLTAQVNFTLRTSYVLLPQNGRCFINKETGERYDIDFFSAKTWKDYRLSPCISSPSPRQRPERRAGIISTISEALAQPARHSMSWLTSTNENKENSPAEAIETKAENTADHITEATEAIKPERPLSPTMGDGQSRKEKPAVATTSTLPVPAATEYLERTLASVLQFKQELSHKAPLQDSNSYPPVGVMFSKTTPTVYGAFVKSRSDIQYDDAFDDLAFAAGDGVVLASAAQLPVGYRCVRGGRIESERGHVGLLGDLEGVGRCLTAVLEGRRQGIGLGAYRDEARLPAGEP